MSNTHEEMPLDVLFVGAGPANLAGAIRLMQLAAVHGLEIEVGIIEKGSEIGAHSLSGAVLDPIALKELIPGYLEKNCPIEETDCHDEVYFLTSGGQYKLPYLPRYMHNDGCHVISLARFTRWLGGIAEEMGVMLFPGFAGTEVLYGEDGKSVTGVRTGDKGVDKNGGRKPVHEPGVDLTARVTVFGEGPRGSLIRDVDRRLRIFPPGMPQVYETAIKEVIKLPAGGPFHSGETNVIHTMGHPYGMNTKAGGFIYRMRDDRVALGLVLGLDYEDPAIEPYRQFLRFKHHPLIASLLQGGKVLQQGAKTLCVGGYYTRPRLSVDGALFVGDSASMLNSQRLKGIHTAMMSGMLAAETIVKAIQKDDCSAGVLKAYDEAIADSWVERELFESRNFSQALSSKGIMRFVHLGAQYVSNGKGLKDPLPIQDDSGTLKRKAGTAEDTGGVETDATLYVDKLTGVYLSGTQHEEDQPCHLKIHDPDRCVGDCYEKYGNPCTRFCPGSVYEMDIAEDGGRRLKLNPSNCLHCKTCEIKDPFKNITWTCPEGGGGPNFTIV